MKPKTPEDLAREGRDKDKYTLYLNNSLMEEVNKRATKAGTSASKIVNEAISTYLQTLKERKSE